MTSLFSGVTRRGLCDVVVALADCTRSCMQVRRARVMVIIMKSAAATMSLDFSVTTAKHHPPTLPGHPRPTRPPIGPHAALHRGPRGPLGGRCRGRHDPGGHIGIRLAGRRHEGEPLRQTPPRAAGRRLVACPGANPRPVRRCTHTFREAARAPPCFVACRLSSRAPASTATAVTARRTSTLATTCEQDFPRARRSAPNRPRDVSSFTRPLLAHPRARCSCEIEWYNSRDDQLQCWAPAHGASVRCGASGCAWLRRRVACGSSLASSHRPSCLQPPPSPSASAFRSST